ncbi:MAG: adenylate kinase [Thermaerobacter sp.]|nr:adenylate kinase [Thermaerobacter sp.]
MRLVLLGAPGAGKGTQAAALAAHYRIPHISTGDIFRQNLSQGTRLGLMARGYMDQGLLVPDNVTEAMVADRLREADALAGFVLDGFPRTLPQADALEQMLAGWQAELTAAVLLAVSAERLVARLTARRVCPQCGATYHLAFHPPQTAGVCDRCGAALVQRDDDAAPTVRTRISVYEEQTAPLITFYRARSLLQEVNGEQPVDVVTATVIARLGGARP